MKKKETATMRFFRPTRVKLVLTSCFLLLVLTSGITSRLVGASAGSGPPNRNALYVVDEALSIVSGPFWGGTFFVAATLCSPALTQNSNACGTFLDSVPAPLYWLTSNAANTLWNYLLACCLAAFFGAAKHHRRAIKDLRS
jgi:hypothetical protein